MRYYLLEYEHLSINCKVMLFKNYYLLIIPFFCGILNAQEFDCQVLVNDDQLVGNSFEYVKNSLEKDITAYINEYRWTEYVYQEQERISCQINIILLTGDQNFTFTAEVIVQLRRPIYNTIAETNTFIISDNNWQFDYPAGKSLIHDEFEFEPLTGFIDYYLYLMLGMDFDTFSELGGTVWFQKSQNIIDLAQNSYSIGWNRNSNNGRNRFVLTADLLNNNYNTIRKASYTYHRKILDNFVTNPNQSRIDLVELLKEILDAKRRSTNNYLFDLFFGSKSKEIASILEEATSKLKFDAYKILSAVDSGNLSDYKNLQN